MDTHLRVEINRLFLFLRVWSLPHLRPSYAEHRQVL